MKRYRKRVDANELRKLSFEEEYQDWITIFGYDQNEKIWYPLSKWSDEFLKDIKKSKTLALKYFYITSVYTVGAVVRNGVIYLWKRQSKYCLKEIRR